MKPYLRGEPCFISKTELFVVIKAPRLLTGKCATRDFCSGLQISSKPRLGKYITSKIANSLDPGSRWSLSFRV